MKRPVSPPSREQFSFLPTPLERLRRLGPKQGLPEILVKRDDLTGLALGGNKARKLEFLIAEAKREGADTVITVGGAQSNHCRQTAAAAAASGLSCSLLLLGDVPRSPQGNVLLNSLLGAEIGWCPWAERDVGFSKLAARLSKEGRKVYRVPFGGSSSLGALGYAMMMQELREQLGDDLEKITAILFPSGSGGTQAGLLAGAELVGYRGQILGISVLRPSEEAKSYEEHIAGLATGAMQLLGFQREFTRADISICYDFLGGGYAVVGDLERSAMRELAQKEGLLLDPVYTARAFGGLLKLSRDGRFQRSDRLLFIHTGGAPAIFAYSEVLG